MATIQEIILFTKLNAQNAIIVHSFWAHLYLYLSQTCVDRSIVLFILKHNTMYMDVYTQNNIPLLYNDT